MSKQSIGSQLPLAPPQRNWTCMSGSGTKAWCPARAHCHGCDGKSIDFWKNQQGLCPALQKGCGCPRKWPNCCTKCLLRKNWFWYKKIWHGYLRERSWKNFMKMSIIKKKTTLWNSKNFATKSSYLWIPFSRNSLKYLHSNWNTLGTRFITDSFIFPAIKCTQSHLLPKNSMTIK